MLCKTTGLAFVMLTGNEKGGRGGGGGGWLFPGNMVTNGGKGPSSGLSMHAFICSLCDHQNLGSARGLHYL